MIWIGQERASSANLARVGQGKFMAGICSSKIVTCDSFSSDVLDPVIASSSEADFTDPQINFMKAIGKYWRSEAG